MFNWHVDGASSLYSSSLPKDLVNIQATKPGSFWVTWAKTGSVQFWYSEPPCAPDVLHAKRRIEFTLTEGEGL